MRAIRARLGFDAEKEGGLTLIEVIVALMIFGIVALGVGYSLASILTITNDARSRVIATNIAAEYIDNARSIENVFTVVDQHNITREVGGKNYHVRLETGWVNSSDSNAQCGAANATGAGALEYKRINVEVTWDGMRTATKPIRSDTIIAPNSRINDPALGTIVVSAENALGAGTSGVTVVVTPNGGGAVAVPAQGLPTDSDGCSYILKVVPGNYLVTLSRSNYIGLNQVLGSVTTDVSVTAGQSAIAKVSFDQAASITSTFPSGTRMPNNLQTTFSSTYGDTVLSGSNPAKVFPASYQLIAGTFDAGGCKSPDPAGWATRTPDGAFGERMDPVSVAAAGSASVPLPLGIVDINSSAIKNQYIHAEILNTKPNGDPGCATPLNSARANFTTYQFSPTSATNAKLALPYGTYKLTYSATATGSRTNLLGTVLNVLGVPIGAASTTITVDPRFVH